MASTAFQLKKQAILKQISVPEEEYTDLSPKGSIDAGIRFLVDEINDCNQYVTTSSCAGRVSVFLEGVSKHDEEGGPENGGRSAAIDMKGGGGRWLYVSHDPIDLNKLQDDEGLMTLFGLTTPPTNPFPLPSSASKKLRFVHFKYEPMILHILTSDVTAAQTLHTAGMTAGFRESGISNILPTGTSPATPLVAIRTHGLHLSSIIGVLIPASPLPEPISLVPAAQLRMLVDMANQRFEVNAARLERFRQEVLSRAKLGVEGKENKRGKERGEWEPIEARRERMRREGLAKREAKVRDLSGEDDVLFDDDGGLLNGVV